MKKMLISYFHSHYLNIILQEPKDCKNIKKCIETPKDKFQCYTPLIPS